MNYRHAFHAGNFAEVVKHAILGRVIVHLREKPTAFRVIDTHAGAGLTDLSGPEATRTGEWCDGIGRLRAAELAAPVRALLAPYLDAIAAHNPPDRLAVSWPVGLGAVTVFGLVLVMTRIVSLSSMLAALTAIVLVCAVEHPLPYRLLVIGGGLYVIIRHRANIQRLLAGTEPRLRWWRVH